MLYLYIAQQHVFSIGEKVIQKKKIVMNGKKGNTYFLKAKLLQRRTTSIYNVNIDIITLFSWDSYIFTYGMKIY